MTMYARVIAGHGGGRCGYLAAGPRCVAGLAAGRVVAGRVRGARMVVLSDWFAPRARGRVLGPGREGRMPAESPSGGPVSGCASFRLCQ
jgi:hypothetical protein